MFVYYIMPLYGTLNFVKIYRKVLRHTKFSELLGLWTSLLEHWTMDKVQKPSNPECYTP
jgi:hypothetical protein